MNVRHLEDTTINQNHDFLSKHDAVQIGDLYLASLSHIPDVIQMQPSIGSHIRSREMVMMYCERTVAMLRDDLLLIPK